MTSAEIRQSFLDFFREKEHTIVPSSSLLPDSPNLLFTNAGMNQFVPIFLGKEKAPWRPPRTADTQKCIRAGGKHNDLEDVGLDTYHHTFFEMLGNWSFGDYFKKEAIEWAWELIVERWKFPANRIYATVYCPHMDMDRWKRELKATINEIRGLPRDWIEEVDGGVIERIDRESLRYWAEVYLNANLDPEIHIIPGNKKDNFWMMGETGPCGPCSELHVDLTPAGDTRGALVNAGDPRCIEIWNLVFIQFNANPDGSFTPLPQRHVDTGLGLERVTAIIQGTKSFTDFSHPISNYETDIFRPVFKELEKMSGKHYGSTLPAAYEAQAETERPENDAADVSNRAVNAANRTVNPVNRTVGAKNRTVGAASRTVDDASRTVEVANRTVDTANRTVEDDNRTVEAANRTDHTANRRDRSLAAMVRTGQPAAEFSPHGQVSIDIAFRVIADHLRTLSFAIADGIQPSNEGRGYVLRRILRRGVRYGRTLGFHEPFFQRLVPVLAHTMGEVFPELGAKQTVIAETLRREEESFNRTLDKGIQLFEAEIARLTNLPNEKTAPSPGARPLTPGSASAPLAVSRASRDTTSPAPGVTYYKRRLPHFERPWAKYAITWSTQNHRVLSDPERDLVLQTILHDRGRKYELYVGCVMPDHVHVLIEPQIQRHDAEGTSIFYPLSEILQTLKSVSSHRINKGAGKKGERVWENESFDRLIRSERDFEEKFQYICRNPWDAGVVSEAQDYPWLWTLENVRVSRAARDTAGEAPALPSGPGAPVESQEGRSISAEFAFRLYDEQGFPLDLTELMARERGLVVDTAGFEKLMEAQRARGRSAQKKEAIALSEIDAKEPTNFLGYEHDHTGADVENVVETGGKRGVILNNSVLYAEMGGQVGDRGEIIGEEKTWRVVDTRKSGPAFVHILENEDAPRVGEHVTLRVDRPRRSAIERHHSVTHLLHWALHELVSRDAVQKGSYVGPDKLTFDFSSAALTKSQVREVEQLVNEKIAENAPVSWTELPYAEAKQRGDIMQFFGDRYGERVRVVQIGGRPNELDGYSMELCGGTHVHATAEIEHFHIVSESAIAAGIRRIEAVASSALAGWAEHEAARQEQLFASLTKRKPDLAPPPEFVRRSPAAMLQTLEARAAKLAESEELLRNLEKEKAKAAGADEQKRAAAIAKELLATPNDRNFVVAKIDGANGSLLQAIADALKTDFAGPIFLAGASDGRVDLVAAVPKELTAKFQASTIIQQTAPLVGGKGGGRPESARGAGKDPSRIEEALAKARELLSA